MSSFSTILERVHSEKINCSVCDQGFEPVGGEFVCPNCNAVLRDVCVCGSPNVAFDWYVGNGAKPYYWQVLCSGCGFTMRSRRNYSLADIDAGAKELYRRFTSRME